MPLLSAKVHVPNQIPGGSLAPTRRVAMRLSPEYVGTDSDLCRAADTNQSAAPRSSRPEVHHRRPAQNPHERDTNARAAPARSIPCSPPRERADRPTRSTLKLLERARADNFSLDMDSVTAA